MQFREQIQIKATPEEIFEQYKNVAGWHEWDAEVKASSLEGHFVEGSSGVLVPQKGPKAAFKLTEVTTNKSFTSQAKLPLCVMAFIHTLEESEGGTMVTHSVEFSGLSSFIFSRLIGGPIRKSLPVTLEGLKVACE